MGKGGERSGAGRPRQRLTTAECIRLDVRALGRACEVRDGSQWAMTVTPWRQPTAYLRIQRRAGELIVQFDSGNVRRVPVEDAPCRFGGSRAWLRCTWCDGRAAVLYLVGHAFKCRRCAGLAYPSQLEQAHARAVRSHDKIKARLIGPHGTKPKGMHWRTFERLRAELERRRQVADDEWLRLVMKSGLLAGLGIG